MALNVKQERIGIISLSISIFIHSAIFIALLIHGGGGGNGKGKGDRERKDGQGQGSKYKGAEAADVIPKERPTEVSIIETPPAKSDIVTKKQKKKRIRNADKECPGKWYGGIGIRNKYNVLMGAEEVDEVFEGYAADLAGIRKGDLIIWTSEPEIIGPPGSTFQMKIMRDGNIMLLTITRVKVCY
jgi:hypothetical protein